uniref:Uncharacterized protein n=1 Tax=Pipistrellus kuhlii TaxID=59472 RepID=A0A7J7ZIR8_PIPKU|nr:hypothetical protein mPipKuh1_009401 [Pipistrellus kuhlii]
MARPIPLLKKQTKNGKISLSADLKTNKKPLSTESVKKFPHLITLLSFGTAGQWCSLLNGVRYSMKLTHLIYGSVFCVGIQASLHLWCDIMHITGSNMPVLVSFLSINCFPSPSSHQLKRPL